MRIRTGFAVTAVSALTVLGAVGVGCMLASGPANTNTSGTDSSAGGAAGTGGDEIAGSGGDDQDAYLFDVSEAGPDNPCPAPTACEDPTFDPGPKGPWIAGGKSVANGSPLHAGHDLFLNPGEPQWIIGTAGYQGITAGTEIMLAGENIDIWLLRNCTGDWQKIGTAVTTAKTPVSPMVHENVSDAAGRFFFQIPGDQMLDLGRHRVRFVVDADSTSADLFIEVVLPATPMFVTEIDGTLTNSDNAESVAMATGAYPAANVDSAPALTALAQQGYRPFYLTTRADWDMERTRTFLTIRGYPEGVVRTTALVTPSFTDAQKINFKTSELNLLGTRQLAPSFAFGDSADDAQAYHAVPTLLPSQCFYYAYADSTYGGTTIASFTPLVGQFTALGPANCPQ